MLTEILVCQKRPNQKLLTGRPGAYFVAYSYHKDADSMAGPYEIIKPVGEMQYLVRLHGRPKKQGVYPVNMLHKWHTLTK